MKIAIILGYYNGSKFIREQVDSIELSLIKANVLKDSEIHIFDDHSTSEEFEYLSSLSSNSRLFVHRGQENLGVIRNFSKALECVEADWYFIADQDDVWNENKISVFLEHISLCDPSTPTLIFSDLEVVDENLQTISERMHNLSSTFTNVPWLFFRNVVTGCAMAINHSLKNLAVPIPAEIPMHDHWIANVANIHGKILFIPEPLVKYRQHGKNILGATKTGPAGFIQRIKISDRRRSRSNFGKMINQLDLIVNSSNNKEVQKIQRAFHKRNFSGLWELNKLGALPKTLLAKIAFTFNFFYR